MKFTLSTEQRDFGRSLRELLAKSDVPAVARSWAAGDPAAGRALWARLADSGVTALGLSEADGGFGATAVDLVVGFEELGRAAVPGPWAESVAVLPVLLGGTGSAELSALTGLAEGTLMATVAAPPHAPFAVDATVTDATFLLDGTELYAASVTATAASVDATRELATVGAGEHRRSGVDAERAFDLGALATAAQLLGAGVAVLERSTAYAQQRQQFGRPIGGFQAVKHHLADAAVALEFARPLLWAAALAVDAGPHRSRDVAAAKLACGTAAYRASRSALQVHGAIGYTAEYDLSLWLTKIRALVTAWGTPAECRARVAAGLPARASGDRP